MVALRGYALAVVEHARAAFNVVLAKAHSVDTHEQLDQLLTGRRGRLIEIVWHELR